MRFLKASFSLTTLITSVSQLDCAYHKRRAPRVSHKHASSCVFQNAFFCAVITNPRTFGVTQQPKCLCFFKTHFPPRFYQRAQLRCSYRTEALRASFRSAQHRYFQKRRNFCAFSKTCIPSVFSKTPKLLCLLPTQTSACSSRSAPTFGVFTNPEGVVFLSNTSARFSKTRSQSCERPSRPFATRFASASTSHRPDFCTLFSSAPLDFVFTDEPTSGRRLYRRDLLWTSSLPTRPVLDFVFTDEPSSGLCLYRRA